LSSAIADLQEHAFTMPFPSPMVPVTGRRAGEDATLA
jgi:hypothetical protein